MIRFFPSRISITRVRQRWDKRNKGSQSNAMGKDNVPMNMTAYVRLKMFPI